MEKELDESLARDLNLDEEYREAVRQWLGKGKYDECPFTDVGPICGMCIPSSVEVCERMFPEILNENSLRLGCPCNMLEVSDVVAVARRALDMRTDGTAWRRN